MSKEDLKDYAKFVMVTVAGVPVAITIGRMAYWVILGR